MTIEGTLLLAYFIGNSIAFLAFLLDKWAARRRSKRISERTLLILSLIGPFGAVSGMLAFHHKTRKPKFLLVPLFLALHLTLFISIAVGLI